MTDSTLSLLGYAEVAALLGGISVRKVKRLVYRKKLRVVDLGHKTKRFRLADVQRCAAKLAGDYSNED